MGGEIFQRTRIHLTQIMLHSNPSAQITTRVPDFFSSCGAAKFLLVHLTLFRLYCGKEFFLLLQPFKRKTRSPHFLMKSRFNFATLLVGVFGLLLAAAFGSYLGVNTDTSAPLYSSVPARRVANTTPSAPSAPTIASVAPGTDAATNSARPLVNKGPQGGVITSHLIKKPLTFPKNPKPGTDPWLVVTWTNTLADVGTQNGGDQNGGDSWGANSSGGSPGGPATANTHGIQGAPASLPFSK